MINLLMYLNIFVLYVIYGAVLRGILTWILPKGLHEGFDTLVLGIRRGVIRILERRETKNAELLFLTRLAIPFLFMFLMEGMVAYFLMIWGEYLALTIMLFILRLYIFMNVAPTKEDWELLLETDALSRILLIFKMVAIITMYTFLNSEVFSEFKDTYLPMMIGIIPFSALNIQRQKPIELKL